MAEMADTGEDHGQAELIGGFNDFLVIDRASRLDDGGSAGLSYNFQAIWEWEERVRRGD